ncbi:thermonuclease family protein [Geminicoccus harenae]|uniref:thermonuclease family protein n=2 Tax=Geminicoccus harenae TaxID=2498453 RepID=UPI001C984A40|nr:thermonuclease family protein [Geminicoccus harenae]
MQLRTILPALLLCLVAMPAWAWPALVERVVDGDTIQVRADRRTLTVRLSGIDAPERGQPGGIQAGQALAELVAGRSVEVVPEGRDRYGRVVARVELAGRDVGTILVRAGHAWQFTRYDDGPVLREAQQQARRERLGVWADPDPLPPWRWRAKDQPVTASPASRDACRPAPRCAAFVSCAEAMAWVGRCGPGRLDGDGDGVPCEAMCRPTG